MCSGVEYMNQLYSLDDTRRALFGLEERQESDGDVDEAGEVDVDLLVKGREIDLVSLGQVVNTLYAGVKEETVKVGVLAGDGVDEIVQILAVTDVVDEAISLAAILADEVVNSILSTADGDDFEALTDQLFGHA